MRDNWNLFLKIEAKSLGLRHFCVVTPSVYSDDQSLNRILSDQISSNSLSKIRVYVRKSQASPDGLTQISPVCYR